MESLLAFPMVDCTLLWFYDVQLADAEDAFRDQFSLFIMLLFVFLFRLWSGFGFLGRLVDLACAITQLTMPLGPGLQLRRGVTQYVGVWWQAIHAGDRLHSVYAVEEDHGHVYHPTFRTNIFHSHFP